ncbi:MAG: SDR family oxidoreductase [Verrucomicrobia bacterium]|nr:SDR family oxidoreductase [Verrucomicrobiota bacterium]MDE3097937.1 SDR family oxidoreductase [Verrucomicrobiota bacterium]
MKIKAGDTVLLTGASGGLGTGMARALAKLKVKLALAAHPGVNLEGLRQEIEKNGARAIAISSDLREPAGRRELLQRVERTLGPIDILINNAGIEFTSQYHDLNEESICDVLNVNLEAPMILSRLALPGMLERRRGHIVNVSSLAGKAGPAFQEPYAASKAGLIAFTSSLRATYRGTGVSASVIVPGFVEAGIYAKLKERTGCTAPALLGTSPPEAVTRAVMRAIEGDLPEVIVNAFPVRPLFAFTALFPRGGEWAIRKTGANQFFERVVRMQKQQQS